MKSLPESLGGQSLKASYQQGGGQRSGPGAIATYGEVAALTVENEFMTNDTAS